MIPPNQFWRFQLGHVWVLFCHNVDIFCSFAPCVWPCLGFCSCGSHLGLDSLSLLFVLPFPLCWVLCLMELARVWSMACLCCQPDRSSSFTPQKKEGYYLVEKVHSIRQSRHKIEIL
jgi:hypothetical protein